jgi:glutathione synthase
MPLSEFAVIYMRKDPPCDLNYLSTTWMLQSASETTKLVNEPRAVQSLNEKMATFLFPEESIPACVSASPAALCRFAEQFPGELIAKPLDLFGGRGIERLSLDLLDKPERCLQTMERITESGKNVRLIQPFRAAIARGEIRAFYGFGEDIAWCLKIPKEGGFLANTSAGASLEPYEPSSDLKKKMDRVAKKLLAHGAYFVGFDIIAEEISEINLTSPRLLYANSKQRDEAFSKLTELCRKAALEDHC